MQIELRQRKEMRGPIADGLLLGLWIGEVLGAAEYWLLRGAAAAVAFARRTFLGPVLASVLAAIAGFWAARTLTTATDLPRFAVLDVKAICDAAVLFRSVKGRWPTRVDEMIPRYLRSLRADPWGHNYVLFRGEGGFAAASAGADGMLGTGDDVIAVAGTNPAQASRAETRDAAEQASARWRLEWSGHSYHLLIADPGPLAKIGLENGDVIANIDGVPFATTNDVDQAFARLADSRVVDVRLDVLRSGKPVRLMTNRAAFVSGLKDR